MKIWIDITNSPHVNFFADLIKQFEQDGHEVLITCRPLANTIELLDLNKLPYEEVGKHYGRNKIRKALGILTRCSALYRALKGRQIDVAISQSSFYSPVVARMLGISSIYLNDNEHSTGNKIGFRFARKIMVPEFLSDAALQKQGAKLSKVSKYPGIKEGIYLWSLQQGKANKPAQEKPTIIVRPEPWAAEYYSGGRNFLDDMLLGLTDHAKIILLPRGEVQAAHYREAKFNQINIPQIPLTLDDFQEQCDIFVGAGGTMTREAAVLGIPTISIYQDSLLAVDDYLVECKAMVHNPQASAEDVIEFLADANRRAPEQTLLDKGQQAFHLIKSTLYELGS